MNIKEYIGKALPGCKTWFSLPTIRTDSTKANTIIRNLKVKMLKKTYMLLDNYNIEELDIGKRGLHFNGSGNKKMASNIISLIKRL